MDPREASWGASWLGRAEGVLLVSNVAQYVKGYLSPSLADSLAAEPALLGKSLASEGEYGSAMFGCSARYQEGSSTPRMHTAISLKRMAHA